MTLATEVNREIERLEALELTGLLDSAPEPEFDQIVELAAAICGTSIGLVTILSEERQWFKSVIGLDFREMPRELAFCNYTIQQQDVMVVNDATKDSRFNTNAIVTGEPGIRFYAGVPITTPEGHALGALCVLDKQPHELTQSQENALAVLARQVNAQLELRAKRKEVEQTQRVLESALIDLHSSEDRFRAFMDSGPFVSFMKDPDGRLCYYNKRFADRFGITQQEWVGRSDYELWPEEQANIFRENDLAVLAADKLMVVDEQTKDFEGDTISWRSYKFVCRHSDGRVLLAGMAMDVTEEKLKEAALTQAESDLRTANLLLQNLAITDALTGLGNRRVFDDRMNSVMSTASRADRTASLLLIDIDHFKARNDRFGHLDGDMVLKEVARVLRSVMRATDVAVRLGGDEFAILLPDATETEAAELARRLRREAHQVDWAHERVTLSIGIAERESGNPGAAAFIAMADAALYAAKSAGRDYVYCASDLT